MSDASKALGAMLRARRIAAGLSRAEVARRMHSYGPIISRIERGKHDQSLDTLHRYAAAVGCVVRLSLELDLREAALPPESFAKGVEP